MSGRLSHMRGLSLLLILALVGCESADLVDESNDDTLNDPGDAADPDIKPQQFQTCTSSAPPSDLPTVDWSRLTNEVITLGDPWHSSQDVIAVAGKDGFIAGKFSYGAISKDLEGERIEVWLDDCSGDYQLLGEQVSDSDGRIALPIESADLPAIGEYGLYLRVMGDNSDARARLRVYPAGTRFIVFDIDATLTTSDTELVGEVITEILADGRTPEARAGAKAIVELRHDTQNYEVVYLTGRPYLLDGLTRAWLSDLGFPAGTLHLTDDVAHSWPSEGQVGDFKAGFLGQLIDAGFEVHAAYGNATSDIYAYEQTGIAKERTFILGDHGGENDTVALGEGYVDHVTAIREQPVAEQPFVR